MKKTILLICWILLLISGELRAANSTETTIYLDVLTNEDEKQANDTVTSKTIRIHFRLNRTEIDRAYMDNSYTLDYVDRVFAENSIEAGDYIVITGRASPEGPYRNNQRLARERALALKNYILQQHPQISDEQIVILSGGEDWDGLIAMIEKEETMPYRWELRQILASNQNREAQKQLLKKLDGGKAYKYLLQHVLPQLRESVTGTIYYRKGGLFDKALVKTDTIELLRVDTVYMEVPVWIERDCPERKPFMMAVKTNLLYDALLLPNLAIEIPFGRNNRNWSVEMEGNWSWWNTNADSYHYHRIQMAGLELRHWMGDRTQRRPLTGWYAGIYGYGGTYDLRLFAKKDTDKGQLSDLSYSAGLSLGYAMPIARKWNLEFELAAGYFGGEYKKYNHSTCEDGTFPWLSTHKRNYFGLTKAKVSIVWVIGK
ncbi:DUF3575 domain-containing protein [Bacteroides sp. 519]|uniref:DUF3575 domain-containing protein n=1 Tax=Bacteroides sp. 519 TaxID=2302937 RepID=UPI0013D10DA6